MVMRMSDPFSAVAALQRALEQSRSSNLLGDTTSAGGAYPPINVFQRGDNYVLVAEIPGVDKSDLDVSVKGRQVRLTGKKAISYEEKASIHRRERLDGDFDRTLSIPQDIDAASVKAEYRNGILAVFLPMAAHAKGRSVTID